MDTRRRSGYAAAAITAAMTTAVALLPATPAFAYPASCPQYGYVCGYEKARYDTSGGYEIDPALRAGTCDVIALRNQWSSIWNSGPRRVYFYRNTTCTGTDYKWLDPQTGVGSVATAWGPTTWDNQIDAVKY
jgi:Peptidase inhibitor family I36